MGRRRERGSPSGSDGRQSEGPGELGLYPQGSCGYSSSPAHHTGCFCAIPIATGEVHTELQSGFCCELDKRVGKKDGGGEKMKVEDLQYLGPQIGWEGREMLFCISPCPHHFQNYLTPGESQPTSIYCVPTMCKYTYFILNSDLSTQKYEVLGLCQ